MKSRKDWEKPFDQLLCYMHAASQRPTSLLWLDRKDDEVKIAFYDSATMAAICGFIISFKKGEN